jgi:hypothetical protein
VDTAHQHLTIAVGAAKEHARGLVVDRSTAMTGRSSSLYLSLVAMHRDLLTVELPGAPMDHFVPELQRLLLLSRGHFVSVRPLIEAALRVALDGNRGREGA